jgi:hypothetical protein
MNKLALAKSVCWENSLPQKEEIVVDIPKELLRSFCSFFERENLSLSQFIEKAQNKVLIPQLCVWVESFRKKIVAYPGFVCLRPPFSLSDNQLRLFYFLTAQTLGKLNDRYDELFDVKDRGLDYTKQAIPVSKTKASTGFHTDSTALEYSPDIVGLLCINPARTGGESLLANAADVYCWLQNEHPEYLNLLCTPIIRDVITPGTEKNIEAIRKNKFPVFSFDESGLKFRYMRYWITTGYQKSDTEIPENLEKALDCIDQFLHTDENVYKFMLERGDMLFVNNRFLCHNRTAFQDFYEQEKKRTLVRTWINNR